MATQTAARGAKGATTDALYLWQAQDRKGQVLRGQLRAISEAAAKEQLRKQGMRAITLKKQGAGWGTTIKPKEIALFTRQLSTMMKAGIPLLQAFDIVGQGSTNASLARLVSTIRTDVETGTSLSAAFKRHPLYFDNLYCNLVAAGEAAGILDTLLDRLATYMEKMEGVKSKIKSALTYPIGVMTVALGVVAVIMLFVVPAFKQIFSSMGGQLPGPTLIVIGISEFVVRNWYLMFGGLFGGIFISIRMLRASPELQSKRDRLLLRLPMFGGLIRKSCIARWTRTLATMFAAGVPLVEALEAVGGAAGNQEYTDGTTRMRQLVSSGISLTAAMSDSGLFPPMVLQMAAIGEEAGSLDFMLSKSAEFFEAEVDDAVAGISSLIEPFLIAFLGVVVGGIMVAMYLPVFKMGQTI
jgi:type IV pilus assembly protein PilC